MQDTAPPTVTVQIQPSPSPAIPTWMGEVAVFAHVLTHTGMLKTIQEQVRFARARFAIVMRLIQNVPVRDFAQMCLKPRKSNVSGLPRSSGKVPIRSSIGSICCLSLGA